MNYESLAKQIFKHVGGTGNIVNMTHCMTRLRLSLRNQNSVDDRKIKALEGVMGTVSQGEEYQIIIGSDVDLLYKKAQEMLVKHEPDVTTDTKETEGAHKTNPLMWLLDLMSASLSPLIPVIMGAAFVTILLTIAEMMGLITSESQTYQVLNAIPNCVYHFFPVMIAFTASKRLQVNQTFAIITACFLLYPDFIALFQNGEAAVSVFGIPVKFASYSKQIFPVLFSVMAQVYIERIVYRVVPKQLKTMVASGVTIVLCILLAITLFGPLGAMLTEGINAIIYFVVEHMGWLSLPIIAFINPFMLGTGLGSAVFPIMITSYVANGYEALILPASLAGNAAQVGAGLAIAWMSKNEELKHTSMEGALAAFFGVTEPIIFTVHYKLKRTFISVMIASGIAAMIPGIMELKCYAMANGVFSLPAYLPGGTQNFIVACASLLAGVACGFVITKLIGFKDPVDPSTIDEMEDRTGKSDLIEEIKAPLQGTLIKLNEVKDKAFAEGIMGQGLAILPETNIVKAPVSGCVTAVFPTNHAIGILSKQGVEVLIHIGIDTVNLKGEGFQTFVKQGTQVNVGDPLISFHLKELTEKGIDCTTSVIITNASEMLDVFYTQQQKVKELDQMITIIK